MSPFVVTEPARRDLLEIWEYIAAHDGTNRADRFFHDLNSAFLRLSAMPGMGHVRRDLTDESLRVWTVHSILIVYKPDTRPLQIIRVIHGSCDVAAILG